MTAVELDEERAVVAHARARLETIRAEAAAVAAEAVKEGAGGLRQDRLERDVRVTYSHRRLAGLRVGRDPIMLGRTDSESSEVLRIGRIAIDDANRDPLIIDWRAPAAEPFYRATPLAPMHLVRRRHFQYRAGELVGLQDELFDAARATQDGLVIVGEAALLAALEARRTGRMADIVATIQREQDVIIRAPMAGVLIVQGGPGTGKTAVALHRAAFLLYTHRFPLETTGILLVGPNPRFLRYIEEVLPSLGEDAVTLATPATLVAKVDVTALDNPAAARVKGDLRMIAVLQRAIRRLCRPLADDLVIPHGASQLVLTTEQSRRIIARARHHGGTHADRRRFVEHAVIDHFDREVDAAHRRLLAAGRVGPAVPGQRQDATPAWPRLRPVRRALDRMWPALEPDRVVTLLYTVPPLRQRAAAEILDATEQALLCHAGGGGWTAADAALIEEARILLGTRSPDVRPRPSEAGPDEQAASAELLERVLADQTPDCLACGSGLEWDPRRRRWLCEQRGCQREYQPDEVLDPAAQHLFESVRDHVSDGTGRAERTTDEIAAGADRTFGHIVVDEAQDLSPLQWRLLARRCPSRSMTVAGDLAQASGPWSPESWTEALAPAVEGTTNVPVAETELTVNYRTPAEVMAVAAQVLTLAAPSRRPPVSARTAGVHPRVVRVRGGDASAAVIGELRQAAADFSGGLVAAIVPDRLQVQLDGRVPPAALVLTLDEAKGLEFDAVVVCEPAELIAEHPRGLSALYIALTRTTNRLTIVSTTDLPPGLAPALNAVRSDANPSEASLT